LHNVSNQDLIAQVERDARPVLENLVIELRQADQPETIARSRAVQELDWNMIAFYSDRRPPHPEPEKYVYELINCTDGSDGGVCDLQETVYEPDTDSHPPNWKFLYGRVISQRIVLQGVVADPGTTYGPLFQAVEWIGDPATRSVVSSCNSAIPPKICDAPLITIDLRVKYSDRLGFDPLLLHEEVRLRNASS
ncbi:MAG: hypothetical protein WAM81_05055, partial [Acidimicrobiia bacterium]